MAKSVRNVASRQEKEQVHTETWSSENRWWVNKEFTQLPRAWTCLWTTLRYTRTAPGWLCYCTWRWKTFLALEVVCHRWLSYVFRDPLNEVAAVLVLDVQHLLIHLLHGHVAPEYCRCGQVVAVMFLASNTCWVSLATVSAMYCWLLQLVSGVKPGMQNCSQGQRTLLIASLYGSALSCPGKGRHLVTPLMVADTRWLSSPWVGVVSFKVPKQMS